MMTVFAISGFAESWEMVKNNPEYIYGEGWGTTVAEADKKALHDIISKISVQISGEIKHNITEVQKNGEIDSRSQFEYTSNSYSQATLNNTDKIILSNEPDAHVGRWIRRSEIDRIFEARKNKIRDYVQSALNAEKKGKIDVALKDLYWALLLTRTLRYPGELKCEIEDSEGNLQQAMLLNWIPNQMNEILKNVDAIVQSRVGDEIEMLFTYKDRPINSLDYAYFDGNDWSPVYGAKDGMGVIELAPGSVCENMQFRFEYEYKGDAVVDSEVRSVIESLGGVPIRSAWRNVKTVYRPEKQGGVNMAAAAGSASSQSTNATGSSQLANASGAEAKAAKGDVASNQTASFSSVPSEIFKKPEEAKPEGKMQEAVDRFVASVSTRNYDGMEHYFTTEAQDIFEKLIRYGKARVVGKPNIRFYKQGENMFARGVQMSFSFSTGTRKAFIQDVVMMFNKEGKIANLSFGLGKTAEDDILGRGVWEESARFAIMNFLENYQTAYALKRYDYIERVFDDDAVIITSVVEKRPGGIVKGANGEVKGINFDNKIIHYNRQTKDSYLKNLKKCFASNEFINLRFANNDVVKLGKGGEVYAIQISQEYFSSNYGDKGYLFLMVDINDPKNPLIKVRTWQPEKDPNFGIYGPGDFQ